MEESDNEVDFGSGVSGRYTSWHDHDPVGLVEYHPCMGGNCRNPDGTGGRCGGSILFDLPGVKEAFPGKAVWTVVSYEPLTLTPSVQCGCPGCTHHGYITDGRWNPV